MFWPGFSVRTKVIQCESINLSARYWTRHQLPMGPMPHWRGHAHWPTCGRKKGRRGGNGVKKRRGREREREKYGHARTAMISLIIKSHECWGFPGKSTDQSHGFSKHLLVLAAMPQQSVYAEWELAQALSTQQRGLAPEKAGGGSRPALTVSVLEPYAVSEMGKGSSVFTQQVWHKKTLLRPTETSLLFA